MTANRPRPRLLVVDDDRDVRELLVALFERAGFDVELANDGAAAIDALECSASPPAAIIADLIMPGIVGQELIEYVQSADHLSAVPVAIVSGSPELAPAGFRVFCKPIEFSSLLAFIRDQTRAPRRAS
jgi:two-component system, OmpR family, response regulator MprA